MVFSSTIFLFSFLPIVLGIYYLSPSRIRNLILLLASLVFYTWGESKMVVILIISSLLDYACGILIEKGNRKLWITISLLGSISILGCFKYLNFTFDNFKYFLDLFGIQSGFIEQIPYIALPIGVSFYTFQTMSYTIDVYRGHVKANRNLIDYATFVCLFPQLVAGPIVRYADINDQLQKREITIDTFTIGVKRFIIGLAKKVIIANTFASIADNIFAQNTNELSTLYVWLGIISYTIQIYYDFSGYSDMAIGLGKMFGFDFLENFNYPYISRNIREFWRRWHISLSSWFRDYLYISLGGNRKGDFRTYLNLLIVFFITGLWHGASWSFVVWGLYHGLFIVIERVGFGKVLEKTWKPFQHIYTLLIVIVGWVFFRSETLPEAFLFLKKMFSFSSGNIPLNSYLQFFHINIQTLFFLIIAIIFSAPVYKKITNIQFEFKTYWIQTAFFLFLFLLTIIYLNADTYNPFIYYRF